MRLRPYLLLLVVSLPLWTLGRWLRGGESLLAHNPIDQHTRQARAWLVGRIDLPRPPEDLLEIAQYHGRYYDSFPPTPSIVEVPLVLVFGTRKTPSGLAVYAFCYLALAAQYAALRRRGYSTGSAIATPLAFLFGTNVYASCTLATVWGYGQALGYALATMGACLVLLNPRRGLLGPAAGYVLLSLAVGCRPLLVLFGPMFVVLDHRTNGTRLGRALVRAALGMAPVLLALALYNWARFDNPLEFGHNYLPWAEELPHGIFSLHYLPWNAYHAFLHMPQWGWEWPYLRFDTLGTAFWLDNGVLVLAMAALFRAGALDAAVRWTSAATLLLILVGVLMYESTGNRQFGARYFIDLLPGAFAVFALAYKRFDRWALALSGVSFAINLYGLAVWHQLVLLQPE
ncbi:MAG: hypothetical protein ACHQNV_03285 [Vicinamibacteria bacterium]